MSVTVIYKCSACGIHDRSIAVRARSENEDVADWMRAVQQELSNDHLRVSPFCRATEMDYAKIQIPTGDSARIGDPIRN